MKDERFPACDNTGNICVSPALFMPLLFLVAACCGCGRVDQAPLAAQTPGGTSGTAKVTLVKPELRTIKRTVEQHGAVRADLESPLAANLTGYVRTVAVDIGDRVKTGQVLAEIAVPELDELAKQKEALVRQAEAVVLQSKKGLLSAEAQVAAAAAFIKEAEAGHKRAEANYQFLASQATKMTALAKSNVVSEQDRDEAINQAKAADAARDEVAAKVNSAKAAWRKAQAERDKAEIDVLADEAKREVAKADAARTKALLEYKTIRAPFDGVVTKRAIDPGNFIQPGKPEILLHVASVDKVRVLIDVPETDAALVKKGDPAKVRFPALDGKTVEARVSRLSWSLDPQSRQLRAEIDLVNKDGLFRPGMYLTASITVESPPVWTLPAKALLKAGDTMACFVVRDRKAVRWRVRAGRSDGSYTEVVQRQKPGGAWEPFADDEEIIANPPANLQEGQEVEIEK